MFPMDSGLLDLKVVRLLKAQASGYQMLTKELRELETGHRELTKVVLEYPE